jgi:hypothetical protein
VVVAGENRCPVCRAALWADDAEAIGTRQCPRCGAGLWVLVGAKEPLFFVRQPGQSPYRFLASLTALLYGTPVDQEEAVLKSADSLDLVEVVMDLEAALKAGQFQDVRTGI